MTDQNSIQKVESVKALVTNDFFKQQISEALPGQVSLKRYMRCLFTQVQKNPKLLACTPDSVRASAIACAQMGVEPNGRDAHLIPYGSECTLIIDYKGLIKLALQSGEISNLHADVVCENDAFKFNKGEIVIHEVDFRKERGKVYAVYALAKFKDGTEKAEVMHLDEVNAIRDRSKAKGSGPWVTDYNEMAKKTAFRRLSKWLPLSPEIFERISAEDELNPIQDAPASDIESPAFMENVTPAAEDPDDDIPMDLEPEPEEKPKPKPKKKAAKKKVAKPEPTPVEPVEPAPAGYPTADADDALSEIKVLCKAGGVQIAQLEKFCEERGLSLDKANDRDRIIEFWSNLKDELKLIEV